MSGVKKMMMTGGGVDWSAVSAGDFIEGGYYAGGLININGIKYALIVSPRSVGQGTFAWKTAQTNTAGTNSINDGLSNTLSMMANNPLSHPAAAFCHGLVINGYDDWYLPSRDELEICYRYLKPNTDGNNVSSGANSSAVPPTGNYDYTTPSRTSALIFQGSGQEAFPAGSASHWSSTESGSTTALAQQFQRGQQASITKNSISNVRAIRRVAAE